jgi:2-methylcitrate dehydratase PrpD
MHISSDSRKIEAVIAPRLSKFVGECRLEAIPVEVRERAKLLMLDAIGVAFASSTYEFAVKTFDALGAFGAGNSAVIGFSRRLGGRDAILINGIMIHGLDFDDTYLPGLLHATSGVFPCAFEATTALRKSGADLLAAYILGMECSARIAAVARGQLTQIGFHPSGVVNAFAAALAAGRLHGLTPAQLTMAQGIVLSMAAGSREYSAEGTWTKRLNPGWAGVCGTTAAVLAKGGFTGPSAVYEGRFGFYPAHLHGLDYDLSLATRGLGEKWELLDIAVKPFPACQMNIAPLDAAIAIATQNRFAPGEIENVNVLVPEQDVKIVCEPIASKRRPVNSYAAQFSIPFVVACALIHRRFGLAELERYQDAEILALADRVDYSIDPNSAYPNQSGEVIVTLKDGRRFSQREQIPRGASERPLRAGEIVAKFMQNAELAISRDKAEQVRSAVLDMERDADGQLLAAALSTGRL